MCIQRLYIRRGIHLVSAYLVFFCQGPPLYSVSKHFAHPHIHLPRPQEGTANRRSSGLESLNLIDPRFNRSDYHRKGHYMIKTTLASAELFDDESVNNM